jgi:putative integral membrane protein (TIGR02587 family)
MANRIQLPKRQDWNDELKDLIRGASGGFLFGIPLLYTMEIWWIGSYTDPPLMLIILAVTFVVVFLLNRTDGFRQLSPDRPIQAVMDSVEALALGIICVTCILILLQEITLRTPLEEAIGKVVLEGMPFAIGVALARSILASSDQEGSEGASAGAKPQSGQPNANQTTYNATVADIGATLVGSIIIAFNVAPTDEVSMLAAATSPPWLLALIAASLLISYGIVFAAGFTTQQRRLEQPGAFQRPLVETILSYLVSLIAAGLMLWFFHRLSFADPWTSWLQQTLILGLPATVGGAAGRLAV